MRGVSVVTGAMLAALVAAPAQAQGASAARRTALEILGRHVAATGGTKAATHVASLSGRGRIRIGDAAEAGTLTFDQARPGRLRMTIEMPSLGTFEQGHDGTNGWWLQGNSSPVIAADKDLALLEALAGDFPVLAEMERAFDVIEHQGRVSLAGRDLDAVRLVSTKRSVEEIRYFDPDTGLQVASAIRANCAEDACELRTLYSDYRDFGGVRIPTDMRRVAGELQYSVHLESLDLNPPSIGLFSPPAITRTADPEAPPAPPVTIARADAPPDGAPTLASWRDVMYSDGTRYLVEGVDGATVAAAWLPSEHSIMVFAWNEHSRPFHFRPEAISADGDKGKKGERVSVRVLTPEQWERKVERRITWTQALSAAAAGWEAGTQANAQGDRIYYSERSSYNFRGAALGKEYTTFSGTGTATTSGVIQLPPDRTAQELAKIRRMEQSRQLNEQLNTFRESALGDLAVAQTIPPGGMTGGRVHLEKVKLSSLTVSIPLADHVFTFSF